VATCGAFGLQSGERGSDRSGNPEAEETEARRLDYNLKAVSNHWFL